MRWPGVDTGAGAITRLGMVAFRADWSKEKSNVIFLHLPTVDIFREKTRGISFIN